VSEPDWKTELREQLDGLSGVYPDLHRVGALRALIVALVETHCDKAYKRGLMAGRSQAGYSTGRKRKEPPCPTDGAGAAGPSPASNTESG
jgi:hypothetical protein